MRQKICFLVMRSTNPNNAEEFETIIWEKYHSEGLNSLYSLVLEILAHSIHKNSLDKYVTNLKPSILSVLRHLLAKRVKLVK